MEKKAQAGGGCITKPRVFYPFGVNQSRVRFVTIRVVLGKLVDFPVSLTKSAGFHPGLRTHFSRVNFTVSSL